MEEFRNRIKIFLAAMLIIVISQVFIASLTVSSFEKIYIKSYISVFNTVEKHFRENIEKALRFGKPLDKLYGIKEMMTAIKDENNKISNISIYRPDGGILYSFTGTDMDFVPQSFRHDFTTEKENYSFEFIKYNKQYHILEPLYNNGKWEGTIDFSFEESVIRSRIREVWRQNIETGGTIIGISAIFLILLLHIFVSFKAGMVLPRTQIFLVVFSVLLASQLAYSFINAYYFNDNYISITRSRVRSLAVLVQKEIEHLLKKNVSINNLKDIDKFFSKSIRTTPEIETIRILGRRKTVLYQAGKTEADNAFRNDDNFYDIFLPLYNRSDRTERLEGYINIRLSADVIRARVRDVLMDSLTVILVSILFAVELLVFMMAYIRKRIHADDRGLSESEQALSTVLLGRPAAFVYLFTFALPLSFIALHMKNLYTPVPGISEEIVMGLPISAEMLCAMITALLGGMLTDRKGWHVPFLAGIVLGAAGAYGSGIADNGLHFILYRGLAGLGYGLSWMAVQGFVLQYSSADTKARGIAGLMAGIISGHICGIATGAMLADRLGYRMVFTVAAALTFVPLLFAFCFMRPYMKKPSSTFIARRNSFLNFFRFFSDPNIFSIFFLNIIPYSLVQIGLLLFVTPVYLNNQGMSQSAIGRIMMIYGLSCIYIAPFIARFVDRSENKKIFVALGAMAASCGLVSVYFYHGYMSIIFAVFMLGMAGSIGGAAQSAFILKLKITEEIGPGTAMSIQRALDKLGQMLGPVVFGGLIARLGLEQGITATGILFLVATLLFTIIVKENK